MPAAVSASMPSGVVCGMWDCQSKSSSRVPVSASPAVRPNQSSATAGTPASANRSASAT